MSSSIYGGRIAFDASRFGNERPVDVRHAQNLINNVLHFADQAGQVRVVWVAPSGDFATVEGGFSADVWYPILDLGEFPVLLREDGSPYPWRLRAAGQSQAGGSTSTFRVVVGRASAIPGYARDGTVADNVLEVSTASSTAAWLSHADNMVEITATEAAAASESFATVTTVGGSIAVTVQIAMMSVQVWAKSDDNNSQPRLTALYGAEYYAP